MKLGIIRCMQTEDFCPFAVKMRAIVAEEIGEGVRIIDYTH